MANASAWPSAVAVVILSIRAATAASVIGEGHDASQRLTDGVIMRAVSAASAGCTGRSRSRGVSTTAAPEAVHLPPATSSSAPVVYEASAESSHRMACATSSGRPPRPMGTCDFTRSTRSGSPPLA